MENFIITTFMKIKFIATKKSQAQQGFGLLETTAAAMLSLLFVSMGANLVLTANLYKIKAKRNDVMNSLIRADIESIKYQSTRLQSTSGKCTPQKLRDSFAWELKDNIGANIKATTIKVLGRNYVLTRTIDLETNGNKNMNASDMIDVDPDILPISYTFAAEGSSQSEYNLTVQIIPNASLKCSTPTVP
jgi:hypothetical protein